MTMASWVKGVAALAVTFAAGLAVGVSYERRQASSRPHAPMAVQAHDAMHRLVRELDLDPAQQQRISDILARHQAEVDATWRTAQPHVRATLDSTSQEIIAVLRPEQADKYRRLAGQTHGGGHR